MPEGLLDRSKEKPEGIQKRQQSKKARKKSQKTGQNRKETCKQIRK
jgi:hypothetical protein